MHRIIYLSTASHFLEKEEIDSLLKQSCEFNLENDITGILLYVDGDFIQVLEGNKSIICSLFEKIQNDKRHKGVICVINRAIQQRQFSDWSMGYYATNYQNLSEIPGFENINKEELFNYKDHTVSIFLNTFMKSHRDFIIRF
jgi:hypothetical protein